MHYIKQKVECQNIVKQFIGTSFISTLFTYREFVFEVTGYKLHDFGFGSIQWVVTLNRYNQRLETIQVVCTPESFSSKYKSVLSVKEK